MPWVGFEPTIPASEDRAVRTQKPRRSQLQEPELRILCNVPQMCSTVLGRR
jgi:hypothetical protein